MALQLTTCRYTAKVCMDFGLAQQVAKKDRRNYHIPMSAYHCNKCGCWHVGGYPTRRPPGPLPILDTNHQFSGVKP